MKLSAISLLAVAAPLAANALTTEQKPVIVSYNSPVAPGVLEEAKAAIIKAGGVITHEFALIQGFAAKASEDILSQIQAMEAHSGILIEEDTVVGINGS
ncbi:hypothetical protein AMS68_007833 [Peltaster fructicola]|uniref:Inhibitor I9 domain-containing protein n=1 Tax=Peltaster fructicola TaxID=286661 RepID=A0A6H0Y5R7_9PEZI|nr:hypothetical protein AMS68_007833 [Peltaster fructicola]